MELDWLIRGRDTRAVRVTSVGRAGLYETFGLDLNQSATTCAGGLTASAVTRGESFSH